MMDTTVRQACEAANILLKERIPSGDREEYLDLLLVGLCRVCGADEPCSCWNDE